MAAIKGKAILIKKTKKNKKLRAECQVDAKQVSKSDWTNVKGKLVKKEFFC